MLGLTIAMLLVPPQVGEFGARIPEMRKASSHEADRLAAEYSDCLVADRSKGTAIDRFLREFPADGTGPGPSADVITVDCMDTAVRLYQRTVSLSVTNTSLRATLYPALYRRDFGRSGPPAGLATLAPLALTPEFDRALAALPPDYLPRRALGDCVSRGAPRGAHALLTAVPHGKSEDAAIAALSLPLAKCLPKGETFRLNRAMLRAAIGEAMYKLALAARAGTAAAP